MIVEYNMVVGWFTCCRDYKGVGNQRWPMLRKQTLVTEPFVKSSRAQTSEDSETWIPGEVNPTLNSFDVGDTRATTAIVEPMLAFDTQFGSNANVTEDVDPTLKASQQSPSVAYPIDTRNALRDPEKYDAQNRQGLGIGADGDPMATLTSAHVNAVAYDEYNDSTNEVHHALRAGTKQSTGVLQGSEVAATLRLVVTVAYHQAEANTLSPNQRWLYAG
jgi:hypothetical protein